MMIPILTQYLGCPCAKYEANFARKHRSSPVKRILGSNTWMIRRLDICVMQSYVLKHELLRSADPQFVRLIHVVLRIVLGWYPLDCFLLTEIDVSKRYMVDDL